MSTRDVDETALANSIGSILRLLQGTGSAVTSGVQNLSPNTSVGPISNVSTLSNIQSGVTKPKTASPTGNGLEGLDFLNHLGETGGDEANPIPGGNEPINSPYGPRGSGFHHGVDIGVPVGTTIVSAINGKVTHAANDDPDGFGSWIEVTGPGGISIRYGHLSHIGAKVGDTVRAGQPLGKSGGAKGADGSGDSTGPHLHFEVRQGGKSIDPMHYLAIKGNGVIAGTPGEAPVTTTAPSRTIDTHDALDTAMNRVTGVLGGKGDPGSENYVDTITTTTDGTPATPGTQAGMTGRDNDPNAIGAFLAATRQHESGGNYHIYNQSGQSNASGAYQFIGTTWRGMGGSTQNAADASPAEQDAIAAKMAKQLFDQFHSWRLVAIAWYGGPAIAQQVANGKDPGSPSGQGGYLAYGDTIQRMMSGGK